MKKSLFILVIFLLVSCSKDMTEAVHEWFILPQCFECDIIVNSVKSAGTLTFDGVDRMTVDFTGGAWNGMKKTVLAAGVTTEINGLCVSDDYGGEPMVILRRSLIAFSEEQYDAGGEKTVGGSNGENYTLSYDCESGKPIKISVSDGTNKIEININ